MKLAIGYNTIQGPWGGGNQFAISITSYLKKKGWIVTNDLNSSDLDLILLTEPRKKLKSSAFDHNDIQEYKSKNPGVKVIHRINECDERKGTTDVNDILMEANQVADHTVFLSDWLRGLFEKYKIYNDENSTVIRNGADSEIFHSRGRNQWNRKGSFLNRKNPVKLVTHHWGASWLKGFDIYEHLDQIIGSSFAGYNLEFTYIGNIPKDFQFKNTKVVKPQHGRALAREIKKNHVYVTGSRNEPGGMHHIEGSLCGLPPLFRYSGALTEHCEGFGVGFHSLEDFETSLTTMLNHYEKYSAKILDYPYTSHKMSEEYEKLFLQIISKNG